MKFHSLQQWKLPIQHKAGREKVSDATRLYALQCPWFKIYQIAAESPPISPADRKLANQPRPIPSCRLIPAAVELCAAALLVEPEGLVPTVSVLLPPADPVPLALALAPPPVVLGLVFE